MTIDSSPLTGNDIRDFQTKQFFLAYLRMANEANARPNAPTDDMGTVLLEQHDLKDPLLLRKEALDYAHQMVESDKVCRHELNGCVNGVWIQALAFALQASQLMFSSYDAKPHIENLLSMALAEVQSASKR